MAGKLRDQWAPFPLRDTECIQQRGHQNEYRMLCKKLARANAVEDVVSTHNKLRY